MSAQQLTMPEAGALVTWADTDKTGALRIKAGVVIRRRGAECLVEWGMAPKFQTTVYVPTDRLRVFHPSYDEWINRQGVA